MRSQGSPSLLLLSPAVESPHKERTTQSPEVHGDRCTTDEAAVSSLCSSLPSHQPQDRSACPYCELKVGKRTTYSTLPVSAHGLQTTCLRTTVN